VRLCTRQNEEVQFDLEDFTRELVGDKTFIWLNSYLIDALEVVEQVAESMLRALTQSK